MPHARTARQAIVVVLVAGAVLHISSLLLVALLVLPADEAGRSLFLWLLGGAGFLLSLCGVVWGALAVTSARTAPAPRSSRPTPPSSPEPMPEPAPARGGPWQTATTPWPRANEDDPNGTLIRPPHR